MHSRGSQVEGNLIDPLGQKNAVLLRPALALYSILVCGLLFGPPGMFLAVPLLVVVLVVANLLYVEGTLGERPRFP